MKPEDRARLNVLRGSMHGDVLTLVRIIDEQAAEIARLRAEVVPAKTQPYHGAGINICPTRYDYSSITQQHCAQGGCGACTGELARLKGGSR